MDIKKENANFKIILTPEIGTHCLAQPHKTQGKMELFLSLVLKNVISPYKRRTGNSRKNVQHGISIPTLRTSIFGFRPCVILMLHPWILKQCGLESTDPILISLNN